MNATTKSLLGVGKFSLSPEFPSWGRVVGGRVSESWGRVIESWGRVIESWGVSLRVGGVSVKKRVGCNGCSQRLKICSISKVVEMNKTFFFCNVQ